MGIKMAMDQFVVLRLAAKFRFLLPIQIEPSRFWM